MFWLWACLALLLLYRFYRYSTDTHHKWDGTGITVLKPWPLLGSSPGFLFKKKAIIEMVQTESPKTKDVPYHVFYSFKEDVVSINDPEIIKDVCIKSFDHFTDRVVFDGIQKMHPEQSKTLLNLKGDEWKVMRNSLSPTFTTGKLKHVMSSLDGCGHDFVDFIRREAEGKGKEMQMRDLFKRYTMGSIAKGVFGVDAKTFEKAESEFAINANKIQFRFNLGSILRAMVVILAPRLAQFFGLRVIERSEYFPTLVRSAIRFREEQDQDVKEKSNDFLSILLDLKEEAAKKDSLDQRDSSDGSDDDDTQFEKDAELKGITKKAHIDESMIEQNAVIFLLAGFDTTSATLSLITYHLALHQEVQERARAEVDEVAETLDNDAVTYDDVKRLEYLDMVVSESLRLTPIAAVIERVCTKDYKLPCGNVIPRDTRINIIPPKLHNNPKYWDDPKEFRPERFSKENKGSIVPGTYLPFGIGPRNCIGMRFAMMEVKLALFHLLRNFRVDPCDKTPVPIQYQADGIISEVKDGNWLTVTPRVAA